MEKKEVSKKVYENLLIAGFIMIYFILLNFAYYRLAKSQNIILLKFISMVILIVAIILIEMSYRKESKKLAINSIEVLILASHALSITHVVQTQKFEFANYILVSSYIFSIYYLIKSVCIYTKEKKEYLESFNDIKEIVTNNPIKKEATKKNK